MESKPAGMARSYKQTRTNNTRMKAYVGDKKQDQEKFVPKQSKFGKFSTPDDKQEARNANRSLKKAVRQETKTHLKRFLDHPDPE